MKFERADNLSSGTVCHMTPKRSMTTSAFINSSHHFSKYIKTDSCLINYDTKSDVDYRIVETVARFDHIILPP
jgi:hypothetical protein